jgi:hypothetical protein
MRTITRHKDMFTWLQGISSTGLAARAALARIATDYRNL